MRSIDTENEGIVDVQRQPRSTDTLPVINGMPSSLSDLRGVSRRGETAEYQADARITCEKRGSYDLPR